MMPFRYAWRIGISIENVSPQTTSSTIATPKFPVAPIRARQAMPIR